MSLPCLACSTGGWIHSCLAILGLPYSNWQATALDGTKTPESHWPTTTISGRSQAPLHS
ncbi:uncharacterized protein SETTUDRAFT_166599 [Exserohilum turcica Et28A]|uniref:Uncharacterized protein n=1 Tax=Exserohilum turcicum (strain 28A) TaxID=671987 RepID=R0KS99_EXST2|nr:uncharacterized protein SETTUDRAFT_166599 [Exserohilum turcica Et28A]EOA90642.1 hypothetical protein SETTUDRAFT_166599 [Exserohilum turcica Et28A]